MNTKERQQYRNRCYEQQKGICHWCKKFTHPYAASLEHLIPVCEGGLNEESNFVMACRRCNELRPNAVQKIHGKHSFELRYQNDM